MRIILGGGDNIKLLLLLIGLHFSEDNIFCHIIRKMAFWAWIEYTSWKHLYKEDILIYEKTTELNDVHLVEEAVNRKLKLPCRTRLLIWN